ncbi:hypothetical protein MPRS_20310 [Mycobacterium paraseoulense]|nr:hypothetical protein MPRS_20310 [Mycobacterium paraseoulense]
MNRARVALHDRIAFAKWEGYPKPIETASSEQSVTVFTRARRK